MWVCGDFGAGGGDQGGDIIGSQFFAVLQVVMLEKALQRRTDLLLVSVHVVANGALVEDLLAFIGAALFLGGRKRHKCEERGRTDRRNNVFTHAGFRLLCRQLFLVYNLTMRPVTISVRPGAAYIEIHTDIPTD